MTDGTVILPPRRGWRALLGALGMVLLLAAPGAGGGPASEAAPSAVEAPRWSGGEILEFTVSLGPMPEAATVRLEALGPAGRDEQRFLAEVATGPLLEPVFPFHHRIISTAGLDPPLPHESSRQVREGEIQEFRALTYQRDRARVLEASRAGGEPERSFPIRRDTYDIPCAVYHLRSLPPGAESRITVFEGEALYEVRTRPIGVETITVPAGTFPAERFRVEARRVDGDRPAREVELWLSGDRRRLPLRLSAATALGTILAELKAVPPGPPDEHSE